MAYKVLRSKESDKDLQLIFDHLFDAYVAFGEPIAEAIDRAAFRIRSIQDDMEALKGAPFQGTLRSDLMPGLRSVTKDQAIFYFKIDEQAEDIRILGIFFGGQDHIRHMMIRLLSRYD